MTHIQQLLSKPGIRLTVSDFVPTSDTAYRKRIDAVLADIEATTGVPTTCDPLDQESVNRLIEAIGEVKGQIEEYKHYPRSDPTVLAELEEDYARLQQALDVIAQYDPNKRRHVPKKMPKAEFATTRKDTIASAIRRALKEIQSQHEELWNHLHAFLDPIPDFKYHPDHDITWVVN